MNVPDLEDIYLNSLDFELSEDHALKDQIRNLAKELKELRAAHAYNRNRWVADLEEAGAPLQICPDNGGEIALHVELLQAELNTFQENYYLMDEERQAWKAKCELTERLYYKLLEDYDELKFRMDGLEQ